jgi:hypothetical protein
MLPFGNSHQNGEATKKERKSTKRKMNVGMASG